MTRTVMMAGVVVALISFGLGITPAGAAEMMQADKAMMKATGDDLMALKKELAAIQAELQKISKRAGGMMAMVDKASKNYCASVPESLRAAGFAPGLCK
jgi:hypothetical protein